MARPFVSGPAFLFIAIPLAAVAGVLLLGVLVIVVAALISAWANNGPGFFSWSRSNKDDRD